MATRPITQSLAADQKTNWQLNDTVINTDTNNWGQGINDSQTAINVINTAFDNLLPNTPGVATDTIIGNRAIDDTTALAGSAGTLTTLLGRIGNMLKSITGKTNWYDTPDTTLAVTSAHIKSTSNPHGTTAAQVGAAPTGFGLGTVAQDISGQSLLLVRGKSGFYRGNNVGLAPSTGWWYFVMVAHDILTYNTVEAINYSGSDRYTAQWVNGVWSGWTPIISTTTVLTGTITHGGTIPLPSGYTQAQCKWMVSPGSVNDSGGEDINSFQCYADGNRVVTITSEYNYIANNYANYLIIGGVK